MSSRSTLSLRSKIAFAVGVLAMAATGLPARAVSPGALCENPVQVIGFGRGCDMGDGTFATRLPDGFILRSHGGDVVRAGEMTARAIQANNLTSARLSPSCATAPDKQFHLHAMYAHYAGTSDRINSFKTEIRNMLMQANGALNDEAKKFNLTMRYRMLCGGGLIQVDSVTIPVLPGNASVDYFEDVIIAMRQAGYTNPLAKYMIWVDRRIEGKSYVLGGTADLIPDARLASTNYNNYGARYTAVWGRRYSDRILPGGIVFMHEAGHNFGLVSTSAPHGTGSHHCNDGIDVMCYGDTSANSHYTDTSCSTVTYDCRHNDYFNPRPTSSNYLYKNWNFASPYNRFVAGCTYRTGVLAAPLPSAARDQADVVKALNGTATTSFTIPSGCRSHPYAISGVVVPPPPSPAQTAYDTGVLWAPTLASQRGDLAPVYRPEVDFNICFYKSSSLLKCAEATGSDRGTVPSTATSARVFLNAGANAIYVFNVI